MRQIADAPTNIRPVLCAVARRLAHRPDSLLLAVATGSRVWSGATDTSDLDFVVIGDYDAFRWWNANVQSLERRFGIRLSPFFESADRVRLNLPETAAHATVQTWFWWLAFSRGVYLAGDLETVAGADWAAKLEAPLTDTEIVAIGSRRHFPFDRATARRMLALGHSRGLLQELRILVAGPADGLSFLALGHKERRRLAQALPGIWQRLGVEPSDALAAIAEHLDEDDVEGRLVPPLETLAAALPGAEAIASGRGHIRGAGWAMALV